MGGRLRYSLIGAPALKMSCSMKSARWHRLRNYELEAIGPRPMGNVRDLIKLS